MMSHLIKNHNQMLGCDAHVPIIAPPHGTCDVCAEVRAKSILKGVCDVHGTCFGACDV